jgi:hypothetical protein
VSGTKGSSSTTGLETGVSGISMDVYKSGTVTYNWYQYKDNKIHTLGAKLMKKSIHWKLINCITNHSLTRYVPHWQK